MKRKKSIIIALLVFLVVVLAFGSVPVYRQHLRRDWKNQAVAEIVKLAADSQWLSQELAAVRKRCPPGSRFEGAWFSKDLALAGDDQWLIYKSKCSKEDWRIDDIFIAKASNGKWYYSTYHFCIGMLCLKIDIQPRDLDALISKYALREFDGQSDDALKTTWPPG
ncbi:MAG: hypothetical protein NTU53_12685 [Planctomycetota bacterium]|nr:hypothetical protein [Planctomycetota bacterium]